MDGVILGQRLEGCSCVGGWAEPKERVSGSAEGKNLICAPIRMREAQFTVWNPVMNCGNTGTEDGLSIDTKYRWNRNGEQRMKLEFDREELMDVIDRVVERTMRMDLTWDWPCGVAYYGIAEVYEKTGKESYLKVLKERVDELVELGIPSVWTVNACAMGHCLITLYQATKEQKYWDLIQSKTEYLQRDALRFGDHVLQHTVSAKNDFPEQAWADTLFMAALFLLRVGVIRQDEELIEDALNQWYWHINYLQDETTGLFYHGYNNIEKSHMSGIYWGRANAWAAYTMSKVGSILPECYLYPKYMDVAGSLNEQLSALKLL